MLICESIAKQNGETVKQQFLCKIIYGISPVLLCDFAFAVGLFFYFYKTYSYEIYNFKIT